MQGEGEAAASRPHGGRLEMGSEEGAMPRPLTPTPPALGHSVCPSTGRQWPGSPPHPCLYKQEVTSAAGLGTAMDPLFPSLSPCSHLSSTEGSGDPCPLCLAAFSSEHHPHQT